MLAGFDVFEEIFDGFVEGLLGVGQETGGFGRGRGVLIFE